MTESIKRIASFSVDHDFVVPGMYLSRIDGSIYTYDLRTRTPNNIDNDYMDCLTMHSVEHMFATYARNSEFAERVVYFGPMGCQTGFYLLLDGVEPNDAFKFVCEILSIIATKADRMFGDTKKECGNYKNLSLEAAKKESASYLAVLKSKPFSSEYPIGLDALQ